ncbi:MAG: hypothetical protein ACK4PN_02925 [Allorhizobium sp.]
MDDDQAITDLLSAALQLAKANGYHFLCYLIEMAILHMTDDRAEKTAALPHFAWQRSSGS